MCARICRPRCANLETPFVLRLARALQRKFKFARDASKLAAVVPAINERPRWHSRHGRAHESRMAIPMWVVRSSAKRLRVVSRIPSLTARPLPLANFTAAQERRPHATSRRRLIQRTEFPTCVRYRLGFTTKARRARRSTKRIPDRIGRLRAPKAGNRGTKSRFAPMSFFVNLRALRAFVVKPSRYRIGVEFSVDRYQTRKFFAGLTRASFEFDALRAGTRGFPSASFLRNAQSYFSRLRVNLSVLGAYSTFDVSPA